MKYTISSLLVVLSFNIAKAETCNLSNALNFSAYAINSMKVAQSDFQGLSGAGNQIIARNFHFGPVSGNQCGLSVSVGNYFAGYSGQMDGNLEITNPGGSYQAGQGGYGDFSIPYVQASHIVNHSVVAKHLVDLSAFYNNLKASNTKVSLVGKKLKISLGKGDVQVVHLTPGMMTAGRDISIIGDKNQTLILNIHGTSVLMTDINLTVQGLFVRNLILNFPEANSIKISHIGGSNSTLPGGTDPYDASLGLQGFIIAPKARVLFNSVKITGSLLAYDIGSNVGPSGQINIAPLQGPTSPCLTVGHPACKATTPCAPHEKPLE